MKSWEAYLRDWVEMGTARRLATRTLQRYGRTIERVFTLPDYPTDPLEIGTKEFIRAMAALNNSKWYVQTLGRFLKFCGNDIYYRINPQWPNIETEVRTLPLELIGDILKAFPRIKGHERDKARFILGFANLYRKIAVHNSKLEYFDFDAMTQRIHSKGRGGGKTRIEPINELGAEWLILYAKEREKMIATHQIRKPGEEEYFYLNVECRGRWGGVLTLIHPGLNTMDTHRARFIKVLREELGMPELWYTDHDLRRTGATAMLRAGVSITTIMLALGHTSERQTLLYLGLKIKNVRDGMTAMRTMIPGVSP